MRLLTILLSGAIATLNGIEYMTVSAIAARSIIRSEHWAVPCVPSPPDDAGEGEDKEETDPSAANEQVGYPSRITSGLV